MSYYSIASIGSFKMSDKEREIEITINNFVNKFKNLVIENITPNNYSNKITLTMNSCDEVNYIHREQIFIRLKNIFPAMKITTNYTKQDMEYFDITFDWNLHI